MKLLATTAIVTFTAFALAAQPLLKIAGPTIVAFAPPVTERDFEADANLADVFEDFQIYIGQARPRLQRAGVRFVVLTAKSFRIRVDNKTSTYRPGKVDLGYYFVEPRKAPRIILGVADEEDLVNTAEEYFGVNVPRKDSENR
ncbi:MAG TPA: hypothetical protein VGJ81_05695 [Thermoanaerobaculia bacterium]|jgi:hypothetical protein